VSFTASPKDTQQCGQIGFNAHLLDELGIRLDPLLLCHNRWVGETVVWVDEEFLVRAIGNLEAVLA
jgi:hypothetical protein